MVYLAINYGCYEGWRLVEYPTPEQALDSVKAGKWGNDPWKILKEVPVLFQDENDPIHKS